MWVLASPKSVGQASRLGTQGRVDVASESKGFLEAKFLLSQGTSVFSLKAFNRLDEAHPITLLQVY